MRYSNGHEHLEAYRMDAQDAPRGCQEPPNRILSYSSSEISEILAVDGVTRMKVI